MDAFFSERLEHRFRVFALSPKSVGFDVIYLDTRIMQFMDDRKQAVKIEEGFAAAYVDRTDAAFYEQGGNIPGGLGW
ncbi:hypothetical protein FACS1894163_04120 [Spirochaetia bacterium]|nr:hypothetical protein FACS1894163_04120 [Spirochaetia bacterium]